ncbi:MAG: porin family protein [Chitinophagaceae bacterium]
MKKKLQSVAVLCMVLLCANAFGQTTEPGSGNVKDSKKTAKTYLDLMVNVVSTNLNYGALNGVLADYKKSTNGIQAGVSFQAGITAGFSICSELYFMRKGGKLKDSNPLTINESTLRLNTVELPVLGRFHFGKFYINAGPSIAYNFSGKREIDNQSTKLSFNNSTDGFKRFDAGIQMGGGFEFPVKQRRIALDIRYNYGLTNIACNKDIYNRAVMISVHFSKPWKTNPLAKSNRL